MDPERRQEPYDASSRVFDMASLITPWSLRVAATLHLPDRINEGFTDPDSLAEFSGASPDALRRLLRHLVNAGLLVEPAVDEFRLTELGEVLCSGHPSGMVSILDQSDELIRRVDSVTAGLLKSVRSGVPVWADMYARPFWDTLADNHGLSEAFDSTMTIHAGQLGPALAREYAWDNVHRVVDVGGGVGEILSALLNSHAHLKGSLVDLPDTADRAARRLGTDGLGTRVQTHGQSFFDPLPGNGDVYLLSHVLHDWPDDMAATVMRRCGEAAGPDGRLVVAERLVIEAAAGSTRVSQRDLAVLLMLGGKERTEEEFRRLGSAAGLQLSSTTPLMAAEGVFLMEFVPASALTS